MKNNLHIVSFDVPYPPDYGGVIDVYNRLKALNENGFKVILHCFDYGRGQAKELENITEKVYYYKRKNQLLHALGKSPMIVSSRDSKQLLNNLLLDDFPILFEGQHSTSLLNHAFLRNRTKLVRIHNVEHEYYHGLFVNERNFLKKQYFKNASGKLKKHEKELAGAQHLLCITQKDTRYYQEKFGKAIYLPVALPMEFNESEIKLENYILYHGNLSVPENESAVRWILEEIADKIMAKIIVAGKNPSTKLITKINHYSNVELYQNVSESQMNDLKAKAKVHLLITFQPTGLKLKLMDSLVHKGLVICNDIMVEGTDLAPFCRVCSQPEDFPNELQKGLSASVDQEKIKERHRFLEDNYSFVKHAEIIKSCL